MSANSSGSVKRNKKWVFILGGVAFLAVIAVALIFILRKEPPPQEAGMEEESAQMASLRALEAAAGVEPILYFRQGFPRYVEAPVEIPGDDAVERARNYLTTYAPLYRQEDPSLGLVVENYVVNEVDESVILNQTYHGIPVFAGQIAVHVEGTQVHSTQGALMLPADLDLTYFLESYEAEDIAAASLGAPADTAWTRAPTRLEVFERSLIMDVPPGPRLVWHVFAGGGGGEDVLVDAKTGEILLSALNNHSDGAPLHAYDMDLETANQNWGNYCYNDTWDNDWIGDETGVIPDFHGDRDAVALWWWMRDVYSAFHTTFNLHSFDGRSTNIDLFIHAGGDVITGCAGWRSSCEYIEFSDGCISPDIIAHEYTHAINDHNSNLVYCDQSGAIDEGLADIMAVVVDGTWTMGDGILKGGGPLRNPATGASIALSMSLRDTSGNCGEDNNTDNMHVHFNSGVLTRAAYLIAMGGTQGGFTSTGIGNSKTLALFWTVIRAPLTNNATFQEARNVAVSIAERFAADGSVGFTRSDLCQVRNGFAAVGLPPGDIDCDGMDDLTDPDSDGDGIPDEEDNCYWIPNPDQADNDDDSDSFVPYRGGDVCDQDDDNDGRWDTGDNCPLIGNNDQDDDDQDDVGNACEDDDLDGFLNALDNCPTIVNRDQRDTDKDGGGDACDNDDDDDWILDGDDNCPRHWNSDQMDSDKDGIGDVCDNCATVPNADQVNRDHDKAGDLCDPDIDGDGVANDEDDCPVSEAYCLRNNLFGLPVSPFGGGVLRMPFDPPADCPQCYLSPDVWMPGFCLGLALQSTPGLQYWVSDDYGQRTNPTSSDDYQVAFDFEPLGGHQYYLNIAYLPGTQLPAGTAVGFSLYTSYCGDLPPLNQTLPGALQPQSLDPLLMPLIDTLTPTFTAPAQNFIVTPSKTPQPISCADQTEYDTCKISGCYWWWADGTCHDEPEPQASCSDYTSKEECEPAGCSWWDNVSCHDSADPCLIYDKQSSCEEAACTWNDKENSCHTP